MLYSVIMVHLDIDDPSSSRLQLALQLSEAFEAELVGFCACNILTAATIEGDGSFQAQFLAQQTDDIKRRLDDVRNLFEDVTGDSVRTAWRGILGDPTAQLAKHARAADLIVSGFTEQSSEASSLRAVDTGSLILSSGRPVLLVGTGKSSIAVDRVLVAWKDTREARRAVIDALPFLTLASDVLVAAVDTGNHEDTSESLTDVLRFLMKHGVKVRTELLSNSRHVGETLLETATAMQADLLVAGGFGHSRLREWVFGGVTRTLIAENSVHRFLSN